MIHSDPRKRDKSYTKWHRELIPREDESDHHEWERHDDGVEDDEWLREAIELECEYGEYDNNRDKKR